MAGKQRHEMLKLKFAALLLDPPPCVVCGKLFGALTSLFGHMKCHPGRHWRNLDDPNESTYSLGLEEAIRWGVRGKRGERGVFAAAVGGDAREAARNLVCLASGGSGGKVVFWDEFGGGEAGKGKKRARESGGDRKTPSKSKSKEVFRCVTCDREFLSYQALGGHRSMHFKERNKAKYRELAELSESAAGGGGGLKMIEWAGTPWEAAHTGQVRLV